MLLSTWTQHVSGDCFILVKNILLKNCHRRAPTFKLSRYEHLWVLAILVRGFISPTLSFSISDILLAQAGGKQLYFEPLIVATMSN